MFTVTTAADDLALLTAAEARAAIGSESATDPQVTALIKRVSASITRACRVPTAGATPPTLRLETLQDTYRLKSCQKALILSRKPVVSVVSIVEADETLVAADYEIHASAGLLTRLSDDAEITWPSGYIVVSYTAGWATVPDDLKGIAAELAQTFWADAAKLDSNLRSVEIPGVISKTFWVDNTDVSPIPQKLINALAQGGYMHHVIG